MRLRPVMAILLLCAAMSAAFLGARAVSGADDPEPASTRAFPPVEVADVPRISAPKSPSVPPGLRPKPTPQPETGDASDRSTEPIDGTATDSTDGSGVGTGGGTDIGNGGGGTGGGGAGDGSGTPPDVGGE